MAAVWPAGGLCLWDPSSHGICFCLCPLLPAAPVASPGMCARRPNKSGFVSVGLGVGEDFATYWLELKVCVCVCRMGPAPPHAPLHAAPCICVVTVLCKRLRRYRAPALRPELWTRSRRRCMSESDGAAAPLPLPVFPLRPVVLDTCTLVVRTCREGAGVLRALARPSWPLTHKNRHPAFGGRAGAGCSVCVPPLPLCAAVCAVSCVARGVATRRLSLPRAAIARACAHSCAPVCPYVCAASLGRPLASI